MKYLTVKKVGPNFFTLHVIGSDKHIGDFERDVDGYFYYWPTNEKGCWSAYILRDIANGLDHFNKSWDDEIKKTLK